MYGVSEIIVIILILMIVVAIASMSWLFTSNLFTTIASTGKSNIESTSAMMGGCLIIENVRPENGEANLRNCGSTPINGFNVYADNELKASYSRTLKPGTVNSIGLGTGSGKHDIFVTSTNAQSSHKNVQLAINFKIYLTAGWNGVSSPVQEGITVQSIIDACGYQQVQYWTGSSYAAETVRLQAGRGYVVLVLSDCNLTLNSTPYIFQPIDLVAGQNLIGASSTNLNVNDILENCSNLQVLTYGNNIPTDILETGKSYWILTTANCRFGIL